MKTAAALKPKQEKLSVADPAPSPAPAPQPGAEPAALPRFLQRGAAGGAAGAPPGERFEREADRAAGAVLAGRRGVADALSPVQARGGTLQKGLRPGGLALPPAQRARFERAFGRDLGAVRLHTDARAAAAAQAAQAAAFTVGTQITFAQGRYRPETPSGLRLLAHEVAHVVQQRGEPRAVQRQPNPQPGAPPGPAPGADLLQPSSWPLAAPAATAQRDAEMAMILHHSPSITGVNYVEEAGGLRNMERDYPNAYSFVRPRMIQAVGQAKFDAIYAHDAEIMHIVRNAARILDAVQRLEDEAQKNGRKAAYAWLEEHYPFYEMSYADAAESFAEQGAAFLLFYTPFINDPDATIADLAQGAADRQEEFVQRYVAGLRLVGTTIAELDVFMWFNDDVELKELLEPVEGTETEDEALVWATISGSACAVKEVNRRHYVYLLNHQYSLSDALATGFERRTELLTTRHSDRYVITTTDGAVLRSKEIVERIGHGITYSSNEGRYFAGDQTENAGRNLAAADSFLTAHGDRLSYAQSFLLFRRMVRDLVFANLAHGREELRQERARFFEMGIPSFFTLRPEEGTKLQADTAALRRHLMAAAEMARTIGDTPGAAEMEALKTTLAAIGEIHQRNPTAALLVVNHRDKDATGPVEEGDYEDRIAGMMRGDAATAGVRELNKRLENIEKVENHLLRNADAVLDMTPLHEPILNRFGSGEQFYIQAQLVFHSLEQLADAIGMGLFDLALTIAGFAIGGPFGLALGGIATAHGVQQTIESFDRLSLLEAMTELDLRNQFMLATPEQVSSARTWAWIGVGLTLLDVGGFVSEARHLSRLGSVMSSPDLAAVLAHTRRDFGEAAQAMGKSERELVRDLTRARGAERARLIDEIRSALESRAAGGKYGHYSDWPADYAPATLNTMRKVLLDDMDDFARVGASLRAFGIDIDDYTVWVIKMYNFDSPGLAFARMNYEAWMRLARGGGTISDARYILHEAAEIRAFERAGFDFNPADWANMGRHARTTWHRRFTSAYMKAHAEALAAEFDFVVQQVSRVTNGRVSLTREVAAAVDGTFSGDNAREMMQVGDYVLRDHPNFYLWRSRAEEEIVLTAGERAAMGDAVYDGVRQVSGSMAAALVRDGDNPTLRELIAIVKAMPLK